MSPLVYVIVLNWNGKHHLEDCLGSLATVDYPNARILLVDNHSQDGSAAFVRSRYPDVEVIENGENLGFSGGNNVGIRHALASGADYVVLLNNDTRVRRDFLSHLVRRGEESEKTGVLGGMVLMFHNPAIVNSTGVNLNRFGYGWDRDFAEPLRGVSAQAGEVLAVTGCLMAIKREVIEKVGLLDHRFFAYFEDVDYCLRVWTHTDFTVEYVPEAVVYHKFSATASSGFKDYLMVRNQYRVMLRNFPLRELLWVFPFFTVHRIKMLAWRLKVGQVRLALLDSRALALSWLQLPFFVLRKMVERVRGAHPGRFWDKIIVQWAVPSIRPYSPGYEQVVTDPEEARIRTLPCRIVMGVNDEILGEGWSPLVPATPRFRVAQGEAACFLRRRRGAGILQVHACPDPGAPARAFEIFLSGRRAAVLNLEPGWRTYQWDLDGGTGEGNVEVRLRVDGPGAGDAGKGALAVNEVALLSPDSPHVRRSGG